jgi:hypothetical protein
MLFNRQRLRISLSQDVAAALQDRINDIVGLIGAGLHDATTGQYESFSALKLGPYLGRNADPLAALDRIAARTPDFDERMAAYWDDRLTDPADAQ